MGQRARRRYCTATESAEIWDRWKRGENLTTIGRVFRKSSGSIFSHLMPFGGIRPCPKRRSRLALTLVEREEISQAFHPGKRRRGVLLRSAKSLATRLEREHQSPTTTILPEAHGYFSALSGPIEQDL